MRSNVRWQGSRLLFLCLLLVLILLVLSAPSSGQQVSATLEGTVRDAAGGEIPQAAVSASNARTGLVTRTTSGSVGEYVFTALPPGLYTLSVEKTGFTTAVMSGISLNVYQRASVDVVLQVGQVSQRIEVKGSAPLVDSTSASLGTVVDQQPIL